MLVAIRRKIKKMLTFQANAVWAEYDENEELIIRFADLQEDGKANHYFMIQHTNDIEEQDVQLGMDTYYIERDDQGYSTYGGIEKICLRPNQISIYLDKLGQKHLAVSEITIGLALTTQKYTHFIQQLKKIFDEKKLHIDL
jgi:hypothetical protein